MKQNSPLELDLVDVANTFFKSWFIAEAVGLVTSGIHYLMGLESIQ